MSITIKNKDGYEVTNINQTYEDCLIAVREDCEAINHILPKHRTPELILELFSESHGCTLYGDCIKQEEYTQEVVDAIVKELVGVRQDTKSFGRMIGNIPEERFTEELKLIIAEDNYYFISHYLKDEVNLPSKKLVETAINGCWKSTVLECIPEATMQKLFNHNELTAIYTKAIDDGNCKFIPDDFKESLKFNIIKKDWKALSEYSKHDWIMLDIAVEGFFNGYRTWTYEQPDDVSEDTMLKQYYQMFVDVVHFNSSTDNVFDEDYTLGNDPKIRRVESLFLRSSINPKYDLFYKLFDLNSGYNSHDGIISRVLQNHPDEIFNLKIDTRIMNLEYADWKALCIHFNFSKRIINMLPMRYVTNDFLSEVLSTIDEWDFTNLVSKFNHINSEPISFDIVQEFIDRGNSEYNEAFYNLFRRRTRLHTTDNLKKIMKDNNAKLGIPIDLPDEFWTSSIKGLEGYQLNNFLDSVKYSASKREDKVKFFIMLTKINPEFGAVLGDGRSYTELSDDDVVKIYKAAIEYSDKKMLYIISSHSYFKNDDKRFRPFWFKPYCLDILKFALSSNGLEMEDIPVDFQTEELWELAIKQNPKAIEYINDIEFLKKHA